MSLDLPPSLVSLVLLALGFDLLVLAMGLRRLRWSLIDIPAPEYLRAVPIAPVAVATDAVATLATAAAAFAVLGWIAPSLALLTLAVVSGIVMTSLRVQLASAAMIALIAGHRRGPAVLPAFEALRGPSPKRRLRAFGLACVVCVVDLAGALLLVAALPVGNAASAVAVVVAVRLTSSLAALWGSLSQPAGRLGRKEMTAPARKVA